MTLRDDCELWATFDAEDVDPNRGIVRDRSGQGRTLEASGGPTYGQPSPVGEAVGFDGTDDFFSAPVEISDKSEFTLMSIVKLRSIPSARIGLLTDSDFVTSGVSLRINNNSAGNAEPELVSSGNNTLSSNISLDTGEYRRIFAVFANGTGRIIIDRETANVGPFSVTDNNKTVRIGRQHDDNNFLDGEISATAVWSRALSNAEIGELTRMTDRMVSKL